MSAKREFGTKDLVIILLIFALALSLRVVYLLDYKDTKIFPVLSSTDSYFYTLWAKDINSGDILGSKVFMKWPLYAYFLAVLLKISGNNSTSVIFFQFILGALNCILVYLIAKRIFNRKVGIIAALLCVFYGLFIFYDSLFLYTTLSLFLNFLFFLALLYLKEYPGKKGLFSLGILLGICALTQGNILIFGFLAIAWMLASRRIILRKPALELSCFLAGLFLILGLVTLRNYLVEKDFVLVQGNLGINFYLGNNPQAKGTFFCPSEITLNQEDMFRDSRIIAKAEAGRELKASEVSRFWLNKSFAFIKERPAVFLRLFLKKLSYIFNPQEFVFDNEYNVLEQKSGLFGFLFTIFRFIFPFWILGMFLSIKRFKDTALLYILVFSLSFSIALFFVTARYRMAIIPYALIFAAYAVYEIAQGLAQRKFLKYGLLLLCALLIFFSSDFKITHLDRRLEYSSDSSSGFEYHMYRAFDYEYNRDYTDAIRELEAAQKLEPYNHRALFRLGLMYYKLNDFKKAEEKFKEAIKANPLSVDSYYNLGFIYNRQMRFKEARQMLERVVYLNPDDPKAHFELACAYKSTGEPQKARDEFSLSLEKLNRWRHEERKIIEEELKGLK